MKISQRFVTAPQQSCGKVIFSQTCVKNSVHREDMHGRGCAWQGACMVGAMCGRGECMAGGMCGRGVCVAGGCVQGGMCGRGRAWQGACVTGKRQLQRAVRILLECILVLECDGLSHLKTFPVNRSMKTFCNCLWTNMSC